MPTPPARLFVLAAGGTAVALGGVIALLTWFGRSPDVESAPAATDHGAEVAAAGLRAKGTDELRQLGCDQAIVMDMRRLLGDTGFHEGDPRYVVTCDVGNGPAPTCERAATAYFTAAGAASDGNVTIRVLKSGSATPVCSRLYAPSGAAL